MEMGAQMLRLLAESLWFFAPALIANQCPGFAKKLRLPYATMPISRRWLGEKKTVGAYYAGITGALCTIYIQRYFPAVNGAIGLVDYSDNHCWLLGMLFGFGAVAGDHAKSFVKRRLHIAPGARWWPFDQTDFLCASATLTAPLAWVGWERFAVLLVFVACIYHPLGNWLGYKLKLRETPW